MLKPIRTVLTAALLTVATFGVAAQMRAEHPDTYVVKKGDTLWDIAGKFLSKPWLWPEIWQANPQVKNPHLIYPGDVLSLAYLDRVAMQEGPRQEAPINTIPLSEVEPFLKNLRVMNEFQQLPYVVALEEDRLRGVEGQVAYIRGLANAQPGQRFAVVRANQEYRTPDAKRCCDNSNRRADTLDARGERSWGVERMWSYQIPHGRGEFLGYEMEQITTGTISRSEGDGVEVSTLVIDQKGREVRAGDRLIAVDAQPYDLQFMPHAPAQNLDYDRARVIAVADSLTTGGPHDVVALSVGSQDGIDNGTVLSTWRVGSSEVDRVAVGYDRSPDSVGGGNHVRLPDELAGHVLIFRTFDKVSYGLVMDAIRPTRLGYVLKHPDATR